MLCVAGLLSRVIQFQKVKQVRDCRICKDLKPMRMAVEASCDKTLGNVTTYVTLASVYVSKQLCKKSEISIWCSILVGRGYVCNFFSQENPFGL